MNQWFTNVSTLAFDNGVEFKLFLFYFCRINFLSLELKFSKHVQTYPIQPSILDFSQKLNSNKVRLTWNILLFHISKVFNMFSTFIFGIHLIFFLLRFYIWNELHLLLYLKCLQLLHSAYPYIFVGIHRFVTWFTEYKNQLQKETYEQYSKSDNWFKM